MVHEPWYTMSIIMQGGYEARHWLKLKLWLAEIQELERSENLFGSYSPAPRALSFKILIPTILIDSGIRHPFIFSQLIILTNCVEQAHEQHNSTYLIPKRKFIHSITSVKDITFVFSFILYVYIFMNQRQLLLLKFNPLIFFSLSICKFLKWKGFKTFINGLHI